MFLGGLDYVAVSKEDRVKRVEQKGSDQEVCPP